MCGLQITFQRSATQGNGPVRPPACVSLCISFVTGELNVPMERMKPTPQLAAIAVRFTMDPFEPILGQILIFTIVIKFFFVPIRQVSGNVPL